MALLIKHSVDRIEGSKAKSDQLADRLHSPPGLHAVFRCRLTISNSCREGSSCWLIRGISLWIRWGSSSCKVTVPAQNPLFEFSPNQVLKGYWRGRTAKARPWPNLWRILLCGPLHEVSIMHWRWLLQLPLQKCFTPNNVRHFRVYFNLSKKNTGVKISWWLEIVMLAMVFKDFSGIIFRSSETNKGSKIPNPPNS